ncbi:hypothetical protein [Novosphingobium sp.]|uniref:hypothetical protein n=1 Tax=Novosphingobium sp. TaxID=1874826 RepID=UPI0025EF5D2F|nr:hypothetical protein [Novosphingobium sp.]
MTEDRKKLARLQRLERLRSIARHQALTEAGRAEGTLAQLTALMERTQAMHGHYAARADAGDGHALVHQYRFVEGLGRVADGTRADADRARTNADARNAEAAQAERRRAAVEERAIAHQRTMARKTAAQPVGSSRRANTETGSGPPTGTLLD